MRVFARSATVAIATAGLCALAPQVAAAQDDRPAHHKKSGPVVVVSGLNNPRQLDLVGHNELLIAEAGRGGDTKISGPEGDSYIGATGSISAVYAPQYVKNTQPHRVVTGLMSGADQDGSFAVGSDGVASRHPHGPIYIQETFFPADVLPAPFGTEQDGKLLKARAYSNHLRSVADIAGYERAHDPDGKGFDSDPYAVITRRHDLLVADAAANDILRVDRHGRIHVFHVFPNVLTGACATQSDPDPAHPGCNFVPTSMAQDKHGNVYVGGLSSLTPGEAQVVKLSPNGRHVLRVWTGFTGVTGVAVGRHGELYVSELFGTEQHPADPRIAGVLTKVDRHGNRSHMDVPFPAGLALTSRGTLFVAAWSVAPEGGLAGPGTSGQVWRLRF
jgi:hypothetical protein